LSIHRTHYNSLIRQIFQGRILSFILLVYDNLKLHLFSLFRAQFR
jgi:hypothetical protein